LTSALVVASQLGMLAASILIGKRGDAIGHRLLMAIGFALLPVQAVLTVVSGSPSWLVAVQAFGGIGTGLFAGLTPIWLVDATRGSGRYNLAQGVMAAMRALGATTSGLLSELMVEYLGYSEAFLGCGAIGAVAAVLLWFGLPARLSVEQAAPAPA